MSETQLRRKALRSLLIDGRGRTQEELSELLMERGHHVSQSTVSRDIKLLGAERRVREDGFLVYRLESKRGRHSISAEMITGIESNECSIVVRTRIGRAPAVGVDLDAIRHPQILACISGDDTVLVIPRSVKHVRQIVASLREMVGFED